jgi:ubiquinone/menaquinone biosynthesis C-methylase UbiE
MVAGRVRGGDRFLDIGCNSGYMVELVDPACEVHGVDVAPRLVERAQKRLKSAQVAKAEALPFENNTFDVCNLSEILEHVFDPELCMAEASRVSRRSVIGSTPHESGTWGAHRVESHPFHVRCYTEQTLREMLEKFGRIVFFKTIDIGNEPQCYVFEIEVHDARQ